MSWIRKDPQVYTGERAKFPELSAQTLSMDGGASLRHGNSRLHSPVEKGVKSLETGGRGQRPAREGSLEPQEDSTSQPQGWTGANAEPRTLASLPEQYTTPTFWAEGMKTTSGL